VCTKKNIVLTIVGVEFTVSSPASGNALGGFAVLDKCRSWLSAGSRFQIDTIKHAHAR
jgi:hypothetical protein